METCLESNCEKKVVARGVCPMHYERAKRAGTLDQYKKRPNRADTPCKLAGCDKPGYALGYCQRHYDAYNRYGDPVSPAARRRAAGPQPCSIESCDRHALAKGMCHRHYANQRRYGNAIPQRDRPLRDRLEEVGWDETPSGCWEWRGPRNESGYGLFSSVLYGYENGRAHRAMYEAMKEGAIEGMVIRHKCDNPPCVNPDHLDVGDHADNMLDMSDRGRAGAFYENNGNMCPNGHDMSIPGAYKMVNQRDKRPYRTCITCDRARKRAYQERKRRSLDGG